MTPKHVVAIIAGLLVACAVTTMTLYASQMGFVNVEQGIRFLLTCLLAWLLIKGWKPGRWIVVALFLIVAIGSIYGGAILLQESTRGIPYVLLGVVYCGCVAGLLTPFARTHFIKETQAEQNVAPNRSLPPSLNSTSSGRGSEDI